MAFIVKKNMTKQMQLAKDLYFSDKIEFGAKDNVQLARFGSSSWEIQFGTFANRNNLRVLEKLITPGMIAIVMSIHESSCWYR